MDKYSFLIPEVDKIDSHSLSYPSLVLGINEILYATSNNLTMLSALSKYLAV